MNKNQILYFITGCIFILLKYAYILLNADDLKIFLSAYNSIIETVTGLPSQYIYGKGYYYETLNILIDKSCSGYNLWLIFYLVISLLMVKIFRNRKHTMAGILMSLIVAYILTIITNSARIITSIYLQKNLSHYIKINPEILHQSLGVLNNLFFLILFYLSLKYIITKYLKNA